MAIHRRKPGGRFTLTRSIGKRGFYRITHPGGRLDTRLEIVETLVSRKLVTVTVFEPGFEVLEITPAGLTYAERLHWLYDTSQQ